MVVVMTSAVERLHLAKPPATDAFTYLTIIEANLSLDVLPTLEEILQDAETTVQIGWDLLGTLLPLLPHSERCLRTIATLGNPREVILKVTEQLRQLSSIGEEDEEQQIPTKEELLAIQSNFEASQQAPLPSAVRQYLFLVSILPTLHARIKTKYPSRFLSTSLSAIMAAISCLDCYHHQLVEAALDFAQACNGDGSIKRSLYGQSGGTKAPDP